MRTGRSAHFYVVIPMSYDDISQLEVRMYALLRAVSAGEETPEEVVEYLSGEIIRSYWRRYAVAELLEREEAHPYPRIFAEDMPAISVSPIVIPS